MKTITKVSTIALLALSAMGATAMDQEKRKPPKEAFEACAGSSEGASVNFSGKNGKQIEATCKAAKHDESLLIAVPNNKRKKKSEK